MGRFLTISAVKRPSDSKKTKYKHELYQVNFNFARKVSDFSTQTEKAVMRITSRLQWD